MEAVKDEILAAAELQQLTLTDNRMFIERHTDTSQLDGGLLPLSADPQLAADTLEVLEEQQDVLDKQHEVLEQLHDVLQHQQVVIKQQPLKDVAILEQQQQVVQQLQTVVEQQEKLVEKQKDVFEKLQDVVVQQQDVLEHQLDLPTPTEEFADLAKSSDEDEDEEFEDAVTETDDQFVVAPSRPNGDISASEVKVTPSTSNADESADLYGYLVPYRKGRQRRRLIPANPNLSVNLWSVMKNCIGRDLTRIPVPVNFGEPLSFLQRLTEEFEYSSLLDMAASCYDPWEQMAYVVAYTVSPYSSTTTRTGKPFNPLLGETYECDRTEDFGWRSISEQVSHHPPIAAIHTEGRGWISWQEFTMSSKFRGKYIQIIPLGLAQLEFSKTGNHYTWCKVNTVVHNIILGRLWVENHGEMDITNHTTGDKCHIVYAPYSYFSRDTPRKVTGVISDAAGVVRWLVNGTWDEKIEGTPVLSTEIVNGNPVHKLGETKLLWQRRYPPPELDACYHFTEFAVQLNEMEEGVAPTDSRHRPDQRLMEQARWDEANAVKIQLEDKQRAARHKFELEVAAATAQGLEVPTYKPKWFKKGLDSVTRNETHLYTGEYWRCKESQDWSRCPDIYLK